MVLESSVFRKVQQWGAAPFSAATAKTGFAWFEHALQLRADSDFVAFYRVIRFKPASLVMLVR
jgi:hypothetical protein